LTYLNEAQPVYPLNCRSRKRIF